MRIFSVLNQKSNLISKDSTGIGRHASLITADFPQMYLWSLFEDSGSSGFLETELNATLISYTCTHTRTYTNGIA